MEPRYYDSFGSDSVEGVERFDPRDFEPCWGTVLVVVPPRAEQSPGGISIPEAHQRSRGYVRIAAVPDDPDCPVKPGDIAICHASAPMPVPFAGRDDLALLNYSGDAGTEILGRFLEAESPAYARDVKELTSQA
jgi:hypothetical protein